MLWWVTKMSEAHIVSNFLHTNRLQNLQKGKIFYSTILFFFANQQVINSKIHTTKHAKSYSEQAFGQVKNVQVSGRLACRSSKIKKKNLYILKEI